MGEEDKVILHGVWVSPFVKRVEIALKLKGVPFEYVEESLKNKSPDLLKYNPVYKKVPVLVHNGRPIAESLVILEYIDQVWNNNAPQLLPQDPYKRAQIRFWADYIHKQLFEDMVELVMTEGEGQVKAIEEIMKHLTVVEDGLQSFFPKGNRFVNGDELGFLDIVMMFTLAGYKTQEEGLGIKFIEEEKIPGVVSWLRSLSEHPLMKEIMPPKERVVKHLQFIRQQAMEALHASAPAL